MDVKRIAAVPGAPFVMPAGVPSITLDQLDACCERSETASALRERLDAKVASGGHFSKHDVERMLKHAHGADGIDGDRIDRDHALVLAYFCEHDHHVFARGAEPLLSKFLDKVEWTEIVLEIEKLMDKIHEEEVAEERAREVEKERLEDDVIKPEEKKRALLKENGTLAERAAERIKEATRAADDKDRLRVASEADLDDELTGSGKLQLSDVELGTLGLFKKGFANRS